MIRWLSRNVVPPVILATVVGAAWHLAVRTFEIQPFLMPSPLRVIQSLYDNAEPLLSAARFTATAALFVFGESKLAVMETFGDADEDGISQTGQIFAGTLGAVSYYFFAKAGFGRSPDFQHNNSEKYDRLRSMAEDDAHQRRSSRVRSKILRIFFTLTRQRPI